MNIWHDHLANPCVCLVVEVKVKHVNLYAEFGRNLGAFLEAKEILQASEKLDLRDHSIPFPFVPFFSKVTQSLEGVS